MRIPRYKFALIMAIFLRLFHDPSYSQGMFSCEDTPFGSDSEPSILKSRYHLFQVFGDISYRQTNFFEKNYFGGVAWTETRLFFPRFSELIETPVPLPDPYLIGIIESLRDIDWEDRWDYGIGIEWRPLKKATFCEESYLNWARHLRWYVTYFKTAYLQYHDEWGWRPNDELRVGLGLYRECNLYNKNVFWAETWTDCSWRKTNFFTNDSKNWTFAFVPKWGIRLYSDREIAIMPYLTAEIAITSRREFWQNRALLGLGIRIMPFRWHDGVFRVFIRGTKIYIERMQLIDYFKDEAPQGTPNHDFRVGFNYSIINW